MIHILISILIIANQKKTTEVLVKLRGTLTRSLGVYWVSEFLLFSYFFVHFPLYQKRKRQLWLSGYSIQKENFDLKIANKNRSQYLPKNFWVISDKVITDENNNQWKNSSVTGTQKKSIQLYTKYMFSKNTFLHPFFLYKFNMFKKNLLFQHFPRANLPRKFRGLEYPAILLILIIFFFKFYLLNSLKEIFVLPMNVFWYPWILSLIRNLLIRLSLLVNGNWERK